MDEKYVVSLRNVAIYHADSVFGRGSEEKLMRQGEMVLSEVNLNVAPGEFVYLIGRVGSGKSSLLKTLYAEVPLLTGEGRIAGFDLRRLKRRQIPYLRRRIGIVFQDYQLLTDRNVFMNLYYVLKATGWKSESQIRERIDKVLGVVQLGSKSYKMPFELSGGEVIIDHVENEAGARALTDRIVEHWPGSKTIIMPCNGLDSYYAEMHGLIIGYGMGVASGK